MPSLLMNSLVRPFKKANGKYFIGIKLLGQIERLTGENDTVDEAWNAYHQISNPNKKGHKETK